jgi:hypothetical protein
MGGKLVIVPMADILGTKTIQYKEGRVSCGRCGKCIQISGRGGYTERSQFVTSLKNMEWRYHKKTGWVCPRCEAKSVKALRDKKRRCRCR